MEIIIDKELTEIIKEIKNSFFLANNGVKISFGVSNFYYENSNQLTIDLWGYNRKKPCIIRNQSIPKIEEAIKELNEKYGKPKRWRAKRGESYYYLSPNSYIQSVEDTRDDFDNKKYELGNYFKTKEQAERAVLKIKKCFDDYHKEIGE